MKQKTRIVAVLVVLSLVLSLGLAFNNTTTPKVEASKFEAIHNAPVHMSSALYNNLSWDEKQGFWEWRISKVAPTQMTEIQNKFVNDAMAVISTTDWNTEEGRNKLRAAFGDSWTGAAKSLFGVKQAVYMFGTTMNATALTPENCSCNTTSDFCGVPYECSRGGCELTELGCGALLIFQCSGKCRNIFID